MATKSFPKVIVYSTKTCGYCNLAKRFLRERGVRFRDIDVSKDFNAAQRLVRKTGQTGVPVLEIGSKVILGFDQAKILKALNLNR